MATSPHLVSDGDEWKLDVSLGTSGRKRLSLSDRAEALLVADLGYDNRDIVPWMTTKTLVLCGGAFVRDGTSDARDLAWQLTGADGGTRASDREVEAVADYLRRVEIDDRSVDTVREHVSSTRLSEHLSPTDVRSNHRRMSGLRNIAKDL